MVGDGAGVVALDRVFHVGCFVCSTCRAQLRGQHFYAVERRAYCESCYVVSGWGRWLVPESAPGGLHSEGNQILKPKREMGLDAGGPYLMCKKKGGMK